MRGLIFLKYISVFFVVFGMSSFSHATFCSLSSINQIAKSFLTRSPSTRSQLIVLRGDDTAYGSFRRAYNADKIEGDTQFVSYIDEKGERRAARIIQINSKGEVELRDYEGKRVNIGGEDLNDIRVSATAKQRFQSEIASRRISGKAEASQRRSGKAGVSPRVSPSRSLDLRGVDPTYRDFRRAYNAGKIEGDAQFVSYIDEKGLQRAAAKIIQINSKGEVELRDYEGKIINIGGEDLNKIRVSVTAKQRFQSEIFRRGRNGKAGASPRGPPSRPLDLIGDGSTYDDFRRAYNAGKIEGDSQFVSVQFKGNRRPARITNIDRNGNATVIIDGDDTKLNRVVLSPDELNSMRVSSTASDSKVLRNYDFYDIEDHLYIRNAYQPTLREHTYNSNYRVPANLQQSEQEFERAFNANAIPFTGEVRKKSWEGRLSTHDNNRLYTPTGYWSEHFSIYDVELPLQGWKFHVSAKPENMHEIAEKMLPVLQREGIPHKVVNPKQFDRYVSKIGNPDKTQQGKFITVYPQNNEEARRYAQLLRQIVEDNNFNRDDFINIPNENEIAPGIFVRYGRLISGDLRRADGTRIPNTDGNILTPDGRLIEDPRGSALPDFVREEMFDLFQ